MALTLSGGSGELEAARSAVSMARNCEATSAAHFKDSEEQLLAAQQQLSAAQQRVKNARAQCQCAKQQREKAEEYLKGIESKWESIDVDVGDSDDEQEEKNRASKRADAAAKVGNGTKRKADYARAKKGRVSISPTSTRSPPAAGGPAPATTATAGGTRGLTVAGASASSPAEGPRGSPPSGHAVGRNDNFALLNEIPERVIGPDEATALVLQGYGVTRTERDGREFLCMPGAARDDAASSLGAAAKPPADRPLPIEHQPLADPPDISWRGMLLSMTKSGWKMRNGNDLFAFMYINPCAAHLSKKDVLKLCKEGVHYFTDEKDVKRYAARHLGWTGEVVSTPPSDRVASRKRSDGTKAPPADVRIQPARGASKRDRDGRDESSSRQPPAKRRASAGRPKSDRADRNRSASSQSSASASVGSDSGGSLHSVLVGEASVRDRLDFCQMSLHPRYPSYKKSLLTKSQNEDCIMEFMSSSIRTEVQSPGFLYIFGGPGTGKTTAVTGCATEAKKWAGDNYYDTPYICFINVGSLMTSSGYGLKEAMLNKIVASLEIDQKANQKMVEKQLHRKTLILVLDEIDMMFKKSHGAQSWFSTLISWADDKKMRFSMIGISNCVNDDNANLVRKLAHAPRELAFSAYTEEDFLAILQARVGTRIIDLKALDLISRRVAASDGDVRKALEIVSNAINKCADLLSEEKLSRVIGDDDECLPLVKLPHMMRAIREGMPMRYTNIIRGLPQAAKVVLCIAVSLSKAWGEGALISIWTLKKYCVEATHHSIMDEVSIGHVQNLIEMLTNAGLLVAASSGQYDQFDNSAKLKLGVQMDDVEIALEQSLLSQEGFYRSLYNFVRKEHPDGPR